MPAEFKQSRAKSKTTGPRVVKAADWSATPARGMAAFSYAPLRGQAKAATTAPADEAQTAATLHAKQREEAQLALAAERKAHEETRHRSHAQGLEQGRKEGEASARARYDQALQALQAEMEAAFEALRSDKAAAFLEFETHVAGVMSFGLRRVFGDLAGNFSEAVLPSIRSAIASLGRSASMIVKVNPRDLPMAEERRAFWQRLDVEGGDIRCVADDRVPKGGCLVMADATAARVDLESLGARLAEAVEAACAERKRSGAGIAESGTSGE